MATATATEKSEAVTEKSEAVTATPVKTRVRKQYRLGVASVLKDVPDEPDGGFVDNCPQWDISSHKELRAENFADVLHYFEWLQRFGSELIEDAKAKCTELAAYGDADTRKEMSEILGNTQGIASALAGQLSKEGMTPEQKAAMAAQIKEILAGVLT